MMRPLNDETRILKLNSLEEQSRRDIQRTHSIKYESEIHNLPVFKVDISFPLFRMENGRTKRKQLEFRHKNPDRAHELDDPSSTVAQAIQESILQEMAAEADLIDLLKDGQHEPLLLRNDGYVVNGNRRLAAMRLLHNNPQKYKNSKDFSHIDVARLPLLDEKEIRRIEQRLQMSQDGKADYNWVDELLTIQSNIEDYGMSIDDLSKDMNKRKSTVDNQLRMLKLIEMYLARLNMSGQFFEVEGDEQAFKTLAKGFLKFAGDTSKQLQLLDLAFPLILTNHPHESKHKLIEKVITNFDLVVEKLDTVVDVDVVAENQRTNLDILDSLPAPASETRLAVPLNLASSEQVQESIRSVYRDIGLQDQANGPAEAVAQAATLLKNISITPSMTKVKQFRGQLKAIRTTCDDLLAELENSAFDIDQ